MYLYYLPYLIYKSLNFEIMSYQFIVYIRNISAPLGTLIMTQLLYRNLCLSAKPAG